MAQNDILKIVAVIAVAYILFGQGATTTTPPATSTSTTTTVSSGCAIEPTFKLRAQDKFDSSVTLSTGHLYQINDGPSTAYAGNAVTVMKGDKVNVLWGYGNKTKVFQDIGTYTINGCGLNMLPESGPMLLVQNTTMTIVCFDENDDTIDDTTKNYTMGTGESATVKCRMKLDTSKKGLPHGGVMIGEIVSGTVFKEEDTTIQGDKIGTKTDVPGAFSLSAAANKAVAYNIDPIMETGYYYFTVYIQAESGQDPNVAAANAVTLSVYAKDCYENSDTGKYECGVETEDSSYTHGGVYGTEAITID